MAHDHIMIDHPSDAVFDDRAVDDCWMSNNVAPLVYRIMAEKAPMNYVANPVEATKDFCMATGMARSHGLLTRDMPPMTLAMLVFIMHNTWGVGAKTIGLTDETVFITGTTLYMLSGILASDHPGTLKGYAISAGMTITQLRDAKHDMFEQLLLGNIPFKAIEYTAAATEWMHGTAAAGLTREETVLVPTWLKSYRSGFAHGRCRQNDYERLQGATTASPLPDQHGFPPHFRS
jgi:hypothetical protein